jgi:hypothetical protein
LAELISKVNPAFRQKQGRFDLKKTGKTSVLEWIWMRLHLFDFHQLRPALAGRFQKARFSIGFSQINLIVQAFKPKVLVLSTLKLSCFLIIQMFLEFYDKSTPQNPIHSRNMRSYAGYHQYL